MPESSISPPLLVTTIAEARQAVLAARREGRRVGLVPTMGALHAGHLSLVDASRQECGYTAVSIFVNPTQFAPHEDLSKYPRTLDADLHLLRARGVDLVFVPDEAEMYPTGADTFVVPGVVGSELEGAARPTHFRGVVTVVLKLFNILPADVAYFGQKDYQQSLVIRRMVADLNVPISIRVCPTIREPDGLAFSSRNRFLSGEDRRHAVALSRALRSVEELAQAGERNVTKLLAALRGVIEAEPGVAVEYVAIRDAESLAESATLAGRAVALIAARVGTTRLIDNVVLES